MMNNMKYRGRAIRYCAITCVIVASFAAIIYAQVGGIFPTVLTPSNTSGRVSGQIVVSARLTRFFGGQGIASQPLQAYIMRDGSSSIIGTAFTDSNGVARVTLAAGALPIGTGYIGWNYAGNGVYSRPIPASSVTVSR